MESIVDYTLFRVIIKGLPDYFRASPLSMKVYNKGWSLGLRIPKPRSILNHMSGFRGKVQPEISLSDYFITID